MTDDPPSNGGYGDTQSLTQGKPMYTVEGNRVGVHDSPRGVMRFEMVRGKMTPKEAKAIKKNLNEAKKRFTQIDRKSTRMNYSNKCPTRLPPSAYKQKKHKE